MWMITVLVACSFEVAMTAFSLAMKSGAAYLQSLALVFNTLPFALLLQAAPKDGPVSGVQSGAMSISVDIAAVISAVLWPLITLALLLAYRETIPLLASGIASRITKFEFGGVSLELAKASAFVPEWANSAGALDLRQKALAMQVNDSTAMTFRNQLMEGGKADYAEVNLGTGHEWITSRLFIMAIVFSQVKEIRGLVFVETVAGVRRRYIGWAEPDKVRWGLAQKFPWLEQAYAQAYSSIVGGQQAFVVTNVGRLGTQHSREDAWPSLNLIQEFLGRIQSVMPTPLPTPDSANFVAIDSVTSTFEHARWINAEELESMLGADLNRSTVRSSELHSKSSKEQLRTLLAVPERFRAVVEDDKRFEYLLDRNILLEQMAKGISSDGEAAGS